MGIAGVKTFWYTDFTENTEKHGFFWAFSVKLRQIRAICVRIAENPKEPDFIERSKFSVSWSRIYRKKTCVCGCAKFLENL